MHAAEEILTLRLQAALAAAFGAGYSGWDPQLRAATKPEFGHFQTNLPLSFMATPQLATHWNAGLTLVPSASDGLGDAATTISYNLGASGIWLVRPSFNVMLELVWLSSESAIGPGLTSRSESFLLNPGIRWAFNFPSGLQIVPGIAYTIGLETEDPDALFLYLSFEHPFKKQ